MKEKREISKGMTELCRKLKLQLEELSVEAAPTLPPEELNQRLKLMEQLKQQLAELS